MKVDVLWISMVAPYDTVPHAGGKIHNFYLKKLVNAEPNLHLLTRTYESILPKLDLDLYNISNDVIVVSEKFVKKLWRGICKCVAEINIYEKYAGILLRYQEKEFIEYLMNYKKNDISPKIIIMEWTECVLLSGQIKDIFPTAKLIGIEEDVSYLGYYRKYQYANNFIWKFIRKKRYERLKKIELEAMEKLDLIILNNEKDSALLQKERNFENKIFVWCPFFQSYLHVPRDGETTNEIIFYGAMSRQENYLSAIWFIENVLDKLEDIRLVIVGGNPPAILRKYENDKVILTGFVDDVSVYLRRALCMVAPLVMGAGVKIKVIEGLSAGIPVLTNDIGIEGIPVKDGEEFFYCKEPDDYVKVINELKVNKNLENKISERSKRFVMKSYNLEKSENEFIKNVMNLKME